jgi:hypothetical protein
MTEAEFTREAGALPFHWRLLLRFLRPLFWVFTATEGGRHAVWDSFSKESYVRDVQDTEKPLERLIKTKRDRAMSDRLRQFVEDPVRIKQASPVAVIAGAGHMPALYATLRDRGYEKGSVRWFEVLEGMHVSSRSGDGRASKAAL